MKTPLRVGLTGGIGSGKSTVCKIFEDLGVKIIDADQIAHDLVLPDQPALEKIIDILGTEYLDKDGQLDRKQLRNLVFNDKDKKKQIENILHPLVYSEIESQVSSINHPYCIICIPLLVETNALDKVDRILIIDIPEQLQISRASQRDKTEHMEIKNIIKNQITRKTRLGVADDIIINDHDQAYLYKQVEKLHERYMQMSTDNIASSV